MNSMYRPLLLLAFVRLSVFAIMFKRTIDNFVEP
jgi:hypothetical protein